MPTVQNVAAVLSVAQARAMAGAAPDVRVELIDGVLYAMGRARLWHPVITASIARSLGNQLAKGCRAAAESCAVGVAAEDPTYLHPDITVLCGPAEFHPEEPTVVMNPRAVFEVLSPGTAIRDCNDKLPKYKAMSSVQVIVYFEHAERSIAAYFRTERGWEEIVQTEGTLHLPHLNIELDIGALYDEAQSDGGP